MAVLGALVFAGLVVGSLSAVASVAPVSKSTTTTLSIGHDDTFKAKSGADSTSTPVHSLRSAGRFFLTVLEQKVSGDWAKAWQSLYPLHKRIAARDTFIRCETATPFPAQLESIHVVRVRAMPFRPPGALHPVPSAAVTVAVELRWYGPRDPITFRHTFHLVAVHGRWTWLLSLDRYRLYRQDACFGGTIVRGRRGLSRVSAKPVPSPGHARSSWETTRAATDRSRIQSNR
jgi:hypothetical protein